MLTIIHGSNISASRKFFIDEKTRFSNAILLREDEVNLSRLTQLLEAKGLFEDSKSLFIENFLTQRKKSSEKTAIISYLSQLSKTSTIFLWESKELTSPAISPFKGAAIKAFKLPTSLFAFLDAVKPGNGTASVQLFHKSIETTEPEMVFFMLVRLFRILLALSGSQGETISEVARLAPWQKPKSEKQAQLFGAEKLKKIYSKLFQIELAQKTGTLSTSLITSIDLLLTEI